MFRTRPVPAMAAVLLALAFSIGSPACQETWYFSSDEAGFQGEELHGLQARGYTLGVEASPASTLRILYRDGKELRRTLRSASADGSRESVMEEGRLLEERIYDRAGNLVEEFLYERLPSDAGKAASAAASTGAASGAQSLPDLVSHLVYAYLSGRLASVESFDASSRSQGKLEYRYDPSGRLLEMIASGSFGTSAAGVAPGAALPAASWFAVPLSGTVEPAKDALEITRYDVAGRPAERASYEGGACVRAEVLIYDATGKLALSRTFETATRTMSETTYDPRGLVVLVVTTVDGVEKSRESYAYDDSSRLVERSLVGSASSRRTNYDYDGRGEISRETVHIDGVIVSVTANMADGTIVKELYDKGVLFLRAYYSDGRLRKEEFIENGAVARTREYP